MTIDVTLETTEKCTHKQPNASMCYICGRDNSLGLGMSFFDDGHSLVKSVVTPSNHFQGYPGVLHGGVAAAMLDEAVGRSIMSTDHHRFMMTVNMTVKYRHPIPIGVELVVIGQLLKLKGRIAKAQGKIILPDNTVACEAELTLADMPKEMASESRLGALGWSVDE